MPLERSRFEAMLERSSDEAVVARKRRETTTQIAGRWQSEFTAKTPRRAAVISHRHHADDVRGESLSSLQRRSKTVSTAKGDDTWGERPEALGTFSGQCLDETLSAPTRRM